MSTYAATLHRARLLLQTRPPADLLRIITEAEDALTGLLEADNLVQVGRYRWDLWEGPEGLSFVVIAPVVELEGSDAA